MKDHLRLEHALLITNEMKHLLSRDDISLDVVALSSVKEQIINRVLTQKPHLHSFMYGSFT